MAKLQRQDQYVYKVVGLLVAVYVCFWLSLISLNNQADAIREKDVISKFGYQTSFTAHHNITILLWTTFFSEETWSFHGHPDNTCPYKCHVTTNKSLLKTADVVLFNARDLHDFDLELPKTRSESQIWMLHNTEPRWTTYLNLNRYKGIFNWTSFTRPDSDNPVVYYKYVPIKDLRVGQRNVWYNTTVPTLTSSSSSATCAWRSSNCYTPSGREQVVSDLAHYFPVYTYGACGRHTCSKTNQTACNALIQSHMFALTLENSICLGYVTEKFWDALFMGSIPVAYGSRTYYLENAPPGSYIHVQDFTSIEDLSSNLKMISQNRYLFERLYGWRKSYAIVDDFWCDLSRRLHEWDGTRQVYTDLNGWAERDTCSAWNWWGAVKIQLNRALLYLQRLPTL